MSQTALGQRSPSGIGNGKVQVEGTGWQVWIAWDGDAHVGVGLQEGEPVAEVYRNSCTEPGPRLLLYLCTCRPVLGLWDAQTRSLS